MLLSTAWAGYFIYLNFQVRNGGLAGHQPHLSAGQPQECFGGRQKNILFFWGGGVFEQYFKVQ
jgi:hypothetical protein